MSDIEEELAKLDPAYVKASRVAMGLFVLPFIIAAMVLEFAHVLPYGSIFVPISIAAIFVAYILPQRRYNHWGYDLGGDRLRTVHGYLFHSDTVVPFGRVQHIDVHQGPIQRPYGLATLTLHTAGTHNSTVSLPGLAHADALAMRETIRSHIRQDLV